MSFHIPHELPEEVQEILRSSVEVVNDDFDYTKFMQAFAKNTSHPVTYKNVSSLSPQVSRGSNFVENDLLRSCPPLRNPVFTFEDAISATSKEIYCQPVKCDYDLSEKMMNNLNEENVRKSIKEMVAKNRVNIGMPILKLQITGNANYEFQESDILDIFSRYGNVQRIEIAKYRTAFIVYDTLINCLVAQKLLHGQYIKHLDIKLYLTCVNSIDDSLRTEDPKLTISPSSRGTHINEIPNPPGSITRSSSLNLTTSGVPTFPYNPSKYTCKYEIQIDNDKEFKIARKIIGPKGCNMKKIIEICQYHLKRSDIIFQSDFLKLRLRGRGSGFKEGPEQKESDDPLHLCVSSKYPEVYNLACKLVEDLLDGLYREYGAFRQKMGRPLQEPVQIRRIEIYNGSSEKKQTEENRAPNIKPRQNSSELFSLGQNFARSLSLCANSNSGPESSNNSVSTVSTLSDREVNNTSPKQNEIFVQLDVPDFKSP